MGTHSLSIPLYDKMLQVIGVEEEIAMRRTAYVISDRLYNIMQALGLNRKTTGSNREGLAMTDSDFDILYYPTHSHIVWNDADIKHYNPITETVILAEYQESIPGTVYLRMLKIHQSNSFKPLRSCVQKNSYLNSKLYMEVKDWFPGNTVFKNGPCHRASSFGQECESTIGFAARKWPTQQTKHWLTRCEKFGWPEKKVLESILSSGCHFVPIGSKQSRHENDPNLKWEWRLSFNQAEEKLIDSMAHCQIMCYALLKRFLTEVLDKNIKDQDKLLCSYFLKTAMFWCIQTDPKHEWSRENFYPCFWKCFKMLLQWVYAGYCPNFFIPENNLFVCKIVGVSQEKLFTRMYNLYCLREECLVQIPFLSQICHEIIAKPLAYTSSSPEWCLDEFHRDCYLYETMILINSLQKEVLEYNWNSLYRVCSLGVSKMSNFEQILILRHVLNLYNQIALEEQCCYDCETECKVNKHGKYKKVWTRLLKLTAEFGCTTDPLYLALYLYNDGRFECALKILEETRKRLYQDHVFYRGTRKNKLAYQRKMIGQPMSVKIKEAMAFEIRIMMSMEFPELGVEITELRKSRSRRTLRISPYVFLRFLIFLCHHRLRSALADHSLLELHSLVHSNNSRYIDRYTRDIAWDILGICHHMAGNLDKAIQAYDTSLQQTPINSITEATEIRKRHLQSEFESKRHPNVEAIIKCYDTNQVE